MFRLRPGAHDGYARLVAKEVAVAAAVGTGSGRGGQGCVGFPAYP